ncbi:MAG: (Fe-S)-binding protein [Bacteroidales bacterium]
MEIDLFVPCFIDQLYPDTAWRVLHLLEKAGSTVHYNPDQTCCGQALFNSGYRDEARELAIKFLMDFNGSRPVVCPSASCAGYIRNYFDNLLKGTIYLNAYRKIQPKVYELTDFLVNVLNFTDTGARFKAKATFHDACAALREYGLKEEPRILLRQVKGLQLVEMEENTTCCGFGGTFSVKHEPISTAMAARKVENALATGADYIISTEMSCLMHLDSYIRNQRLGIRCLHIADVLTIGDLEIEHRQTETL